MTDPGRSAAPAAGPPRRRGRTVGFLVVCLLAFVLVAGWLYLFPPISAPPGVTLADLHGVGDLQDRFNADRGQPRLIVIFSSTRPGCRRGARLVQSEILTAHPQARLRVYAVWVNKQVGDARSRWDAAGLTDPRVAHLWDAKDVSGAWLAGNVQGFQGSDWDTYLLFGPEATWTSHPTPLRSSGAPVFDRIPELSQALNPLLTRPQ